MNYKKNKNVLIFNNFWTENKQLMSHIERPCQSCSILNPVLFSSNSTLSLFHSCFLLVLSLFCPCFVLVLSLFYPCFILLLSLLYPCFILVSSLFCPCFILVLSCSFPLNQIECYSILFYNVILCYLRSYPALF